MNASVFVMLSLSPLLFSQDLTNVNPQSVKVEFENGQIRILRIRYAPHENSGMHSHPQRAVVRTTDRHIRETKPNGQSDERYAKAGEFVWANAGTHAIENLGDAPAETIEIEFKNAISPSIPVKESPRKDPVQEPDSPIPVQDEPHHHWIFENQYVRVLDVVLPPGESTFFHTHSHDNVAVRLSQATIQKQDWGKNWDPPSSMLPGQVTFTAGTKRPYSHRLKNVGATPFRVIDIELLQPASATQ